MYLLIYDIKIGSGPIPIPNDYLLLLHKIDGRTKFNNRSWHLKAILGSWGLSKLETPLSHNPKSSQKKHARTSNSNHHQPPPRDVAGECVKTMNIGSPQTDTSGTPFSREVGEATMSRMITPTSSPGNHDPMRPQPTLQMQHPVKTSLQKLPKAMAENMAEKKKRRKKKWKKPKDKPNRPLSAYNLFFQQARATMLGDDAPSLEDEMLKKRIHCKTHGKIGFADMARMIGSKWKNLEPDKKKPFEEDAKKLKDQYAIELEAWKQNEKAKKNSDGEQRKGLEAIATAAMQLSPGRVTPHSPSNMSPHGTSSEHALVLLMEEQRRNRLLNHQFSPQELSLDYLRALQEQRQIDNFALGRASTSLEVPMLDYPNAAEASANAIMHQFQNVGSLAQYSPAPPSASMSALAMRRFQHQFMGNDFIL
jgi:hypothetical protein